MTRGRGIGAASFLADVGYEVPTSLMASFASGMLGAPRPALRHRGQRRGIGRA